MDIRDNDNVYVAMASGTPSHLLSRLSKLKVNNVTVYHLLTFGDLDYLNSSNFRHVSLFTHHNSRDYVNKTQSFVPVHFSRIPRLIRLGKIPVDVVLLEVAPEDDDGFHSLGMSIECLPAAIEMADRIIACVNKNVPRTHGYKIHKDSLTEIVYHDTDLFLYEEKSIPMSQELEVSNRVAELIPSGATIQTGVGSIPSLVLGNLTNKKDLYIHTECLFDPVVDLIECGSAIGATCTLAMGSQKLIDYVDQNSKVSFLPVDIVNDPTEIASKNIYAINSAISVDGFGQASSDYIGQRIYSGFGGIVDFMRGASYGDGLAILAMTSKTKKGHSKFCDPLLSPVTLTRADIDVIVTEYGVADLRGSTVCQREAMIREVFKI